jgi:hypothetical protein
MITLNISEHADLPAIQAEVLEWFNRNGNTRKTVNNLILKINNVHHGFVIIKREIGNSMVETCSLDNTIMHKAMIVVDEYISYPGRLQAERVSSFITVKNRYDEPGKMLTQAEFIQLLRKLWDDINKPVSPFPEQTSLYGGYGDA